MSAAHDPQADPVISARGRDGASGGGSYSKASAIGKSPKPDTHGVADRVPSAGRSGAGVADRKKRARAKLRPKTRTDVGPGGVVYLVVMSLILAAGIYTQAPLLFWAFGLMVGGLSVSLVLPWLMMRKIEVRRVLPGHGVVGEAMVLRYRVTNKGVFPVFGLMIAEGWGRGYWGHKRTGPIAARPARLKGRPHGWVMHLAPNQNVLAEAPCWPVRRGELEFEKIVVSTSFPFGALRRVTTFPVRSRVLVFPPLVRIDRALMHRLATTDPSGRRRVDKSGGVEEFYGIRPYRPGDSLKMVDWKQTAKRRELVSRELTQPSPPRVMLGVDLSFLWEAREPVQRSRWGRFRRAIGLRERQIRDGDTGGGTKAGPAVAPEELAAGAELVISLAASVVCDAYLRGFQLGMVVIGVPCPPFPVHHSLPHRMRLLEALSRLDLAKRSDHAPGLAVEPTVLVRPGADRLGGWPMILGTDSMARHDAYGVTEPMVVGDREGDTRRVPSDGGGTSGLLSRQTLRLQKRERLFEPVASRGAAEGVSSDADAAGAGPGSEAR